MQKKEHEIKFRPLVTIEEIVEQLKASPDSLIQTCEAVSSSSSQPTSSTDSTTHEELISEPTQPTDDKISCNISSKEIRARTIIKNNAITFDAVMGTFNVRDEAGKVFLVSLEPQSCSCVERAGCCHLLAVAISTGNKLFYSYFQLLNS